MTVEQRPKIDPGWQRHFYWFPRIIASTCAMYHRCCYVEIGIWRCFAFKEIAPFCVEVHGVDINPNAAQWMPEGSRFWPMRSDEFFAAYDGSPPNVIFIDGDHSYKQAKRDFENALEVLAPAGSIFLHDTWPRDENDTTPGIGGEVWKLSEELIGSPQLESYTWPRFPGLTIIRRRGEGIGPRRLREAD
jgi:hypothetical protein